MRAILAVFATIAFSGPVFSQEKPANAISQMLEKVKPLYGSTVTVCAGQTAPGWAVTNVGTDFTRCGGTWDDLWTLFELNGAPSGAQTTVCSFSANHPGWVAVGTSTDFTRCGRNATSNNLTTIRKL